MQGLELVVTLISVISTLSSILFAYLAFSRNKTNDIKGDAKIDAERAVDMAGIKIDLKYTRDGIDRVGKRLDDIEKNQNKTNQDMGVIKEHLKRVDGRLDKVEHRLDTLENIHLKGGE